MPEKLLNLPRTHHIQSITKFNSNFVFQNNERTKFTTITFPIEVHGVSMRKEEMEGLDSTNWLNDSIINSYLKGIALPYNNVFVFNTAFYGLLTTISIDRSMRMSRFINLSYQNVFIIPIYHPLHWALVVVLLKERSMVYIDSMGNSRSSETLRNIKTYFIEVGSRIWPSERERFNIINTFALTANPQQTNCDDCGVFTLAAATQILRRYSFITNSIHYEDIKQSLEEMLDFDQSSISSWRNQIRRDILRDSIPLPADHNANLEFDIEILQ